MYSMYDHSNSAKQFRIRRAKLMLIDRINGLKYSDISKKYNLSINRVNNWILRYIMYDHVHKGSFTHLMSVMLATGSTPELVADHFHIPVRVVRDVWARDELDRNDERSCVYEPYFERTGRLSRECIDRGPTYMRFQIKRFGFFKK